MRQRQIHVAVVDGQGGGVGRALVERFKQTHPEISVCALGTNAAATTAMVKGGADYGATGENAIVLNVVKMDILAGPIGILMANGLMGELTPAMADAVGRSGAAKILIPSQQCNIRLAIGKYQPMKYYLDEAARLFEEEIGNLTGNQTE